MIGPDEKNVPDRQPVLWGDDVLGLVHDLRGPLGVLAGYADLLGGGDLGPLSGPASRAVAAISAQATEMGALLEAVLDLRREDAAVGVARRTGALDLVTAAGEAVARAQPHAQLVGTTVTLASGHPTVPVRTDPRFLSRVLDNLVSNAIKYGRPEGDVVVTASRRGGDGEIRVADDGPGLSASARDGLFNAHPAGVTLEQNASAGIGLKLSLGLAEHLGGTIRFEDADGGGAVFILTLPLGN